MSRKSQSSSPHSQLGVEPRKMRGNVDDDRGLNADLPEFNGIGDPNIFIDWLYEIERIFEYEGYDDVKRCKVAIRMFKGYASLWWDYTRKKRECKGKAKMRSWEKLKWYLKKRFLSDNHNQGLHTQVNIQDEESVAKNEKEGQEHVFLDESLQEDAHEEVVVEETDEDKLLLLENELHPQVVVENEIESQGVSCQKSPSGFDLVRDIEYPMDFIIGSSLPSKPTLAHHIERSKELQGQCDDVQDSFVFKENEVCVPMTQRDCMVLQGTCIEDDDVLNLRTNSLQPGEYDRFPGSCISSPYFCSPWACNFKA